MTFRALLKILQDFIEAHPGHQALDEHVVVRFQTAEYNNDTLYAGGLRTVNVDAGCTETVALVLDADQEPHEEPNQGPDDPDPITDTGPQEAPLEIIVRGAPGEGKTAVAQLIQRTLSVIGFPVELTDDTAVTVTDEYQTLRLTGIVQRLTQRQQRVHIRTALTPLKRRIPDDEE